MIFSGSFFYEKKYENIKIENYILTRVFARYEILMFMTVEWRFVNYGRLSLC